MYQLPETIMHPATLASLVHGSNGAALQRLATTHASASYGI
jgi:hypothetical protein